MDLNRTSSIKISSSRVEGDAIILAKCFSSCSASLYFDVASSYRTLSIHVDEKPSFSTKRNALDSSDAIGQIDVHVVDNDQVFHCHLTHPTLGLEAAMVQRRSKDGKNVISPPTQYTLIFWKLGQKLN
jgi:hypothetical protein